MTDRTLAGGRRLMLDLINKARRREGLREVVLDGNPTAQLHANDSRANCFSGHWGSDGTKPYMRYTLNGGIDSCSENASGSCYCPPDRLAYTRHTLADSIIEAHQGLMDSPGHRRNILNHAHRKVGIGIAYSRPNCWVVQLFASDYVEFGLLPTIEGGKLAFAYRLKNGAYQPDAPPSATLHFDEPPRPLTRGQLARASSYDSGYLIAGIRPPAPKFTRWTSDTLETEDGTYPNPHEIPHDARPPVSYEDASRLNRHAKNLGKQRRAKTFVVPWITARVRKVRGGGLQVQADVSRPLRQYGSGVYSLVINASVEGQSTPVCHYSMFVE